MVIQPIAFISTWTCCLVLLVCLAGKKIAHKIFSILFPTSSKETHLASSSSDTSKLSYDVFLSFRGEDTRNNFTSHLYTALREKGINTFIDDSELKRGEEISPALLKAIKESRISLVIFSKKYAASSWCLDELVQIIECKDTKGQMVQPIFYHVDPSEVRHQIGCFIEAFAKHEDVKRHSKKRIQKWRTALKKAADLSGWHLENETEASFIRRIVGEVWSKLNPNYLNVTDHLVGIEPQVQKVKLMLDSGLSNIHIVGIHGTGGIGKTTIAKALYNIIVDEFEGHCFLANVRERSMQCEGLVKLQEALLSKILQFKEIKIHDSSSGISLIKERLCYKRVLLVLDDIDDLEQLKSLAGDHGNWFGSGSRIIVTTRDEHLLVAHGVDKDNIHRVKELNNSDSLQLLCLNAFNEQQPRHGFEELSNSFINYIQGLPLALIVLGSFLRDRSKEEWESTLSKLKRFPNEKISQILKISYDGLDKDEKAIFLDIACFFNGEDINYVWKALESRGFCPKIGIKVLVERALLITGHNESWMHHLIQDMGKEIVRQESPEDPGQRSRLWSDEDIRYVLRDSAGTNKVEGIKLAPSEPKEVQLNSKSFKKMKRLRLLIIKNAQCSGDHPEYLSNELRWLEWPGYPFSSLPPNFSPEQLVYFDMHSSRLKICHLVYGFKDFNGLKYMNLEACEFLTEVPDVSSCCDLEYLILKNCKSLIKVHESVSNLKKLLHLDLSYCSNLVSLPRRFKDLKSLRSMDLKACELLTEVPDVSGCCNFEILILEDCKRLTEVHGSVGNLEKLRLLNLGSCSNLVSLPRSFKLKSLKALWLSGCSSLKEFPEIMDQMDCLDNICLSGTGIEELPSSIERAPGLVYLDMSYCQNLKNIPSCIYKFQNLRELSLNGCTQLGKFPMFSNTKQEFTSLNEGSSSTDSASSLNLLPSLYHLDLSNCNLLEVNFLTNPEHFPALRRLILNENNITTIPAFLHQLAELRYLSVNNCQLLKEIPELPANVGLCARGCESLQGLPRFEVSDWHVSTVGDPYEDLERSNISLRLDGCPRLKEFPKIINNMDCLRKIDLCRTGIKELPSSIEHITGLKYLCMSHCQNLTNISSCIYKLKNLRDLRLDNCTKLGTFPMFTTLDERSSTMGSTSSLNLFPSLETLRLTNCNLLEVDFLTNTEHFPALSKLYLNENNITTIPTCLDKLAKLSYLNVSKCKLLQEIPVLPPNMEKIEAHGCESLQRYSQLDSMLSGTGPQWIDFSDCHKSVSTHVGQGTSIFPLEGFVNKRDVQIFIPGSEIPEWFSHKSSRSPIFLQVPINTSINIIALALGAILRSTSVEIKVFINGECEYSIHTRVYDSMDSDNLWLCYIPQMFPRSSKGDYVDVKVEVFKGHVDEHSGEWVDIDFLDLKALGVHLMEG